MYLKCVRYIELNYVRLIILFTIVNRILNLTTFIYINSQSWENCGLEYEMFFFFFDVLGVKFILTIKTLVLWEITYNNKRAHILKMEFIASF